VLRTIDKFYRLDHRPEITLHGIRGAIDQTPPRHYSQALKRDAELEQIRQNAKSLPLQLRAKRITEIGPVDNPARRQRLRHPGLVADDQKRNFVAPRIEPPVIKRKNAKHQNPTADTLDANLFSLEIRRGLNIRGNDERAVQLIN